MTEEGDLPRRFLSTLLGQSPLYRRPNPSYIPLDIDIVLQHERRIIVVLPHQFHDPRLTIPRRMNGAVDLTIGIGFERIPHGFGDVEVWIVGYELVERLGFEVGDPVDASPSIVTRSRKVDVNRWIDGLPCNGVLRLYPRFQLGRRRM